MLSESDVNLLEAYLDDALSPSEVQGIDARLSEEPEVAAALDSLRNERAGRVAAFGSMTPDAEVADRFGKNVLATVRRREFTRKLSRAARWAGSLAACLIVGIAVGWIGRGHEESAVAKVPQVAPTPAVAPPPAQPQTSNHNDAHLVVDTTVAPQAGQYRVAVLDESGNIIAMKDFSTVEGAQQFADDLAQFQARRQQMQESQSAMLTSDKF